MNTNKLIKTLVISIFVGTLGGCDVNLLSPGNPVSRVESAITFWYPQGQMFFSFDLIGRGLNGQDYNGKILDGHMVVSVSLENVILDEKKSKDLKLDSTLFQGTNIKNKGAVGSTGYQFTATLEDGSNLPVRIEAVEVVGDPTGDYAHYLVSYLTDEGWAPLCGNDEFNQPVWAIPLNGVWDYRMGVEGGGDWTPNDQAFTFACEGYVLAKCVAMGYPPWAEGKIVDTENKKNGDKLTLANHHQACTRLLRADYCGDGTSYTEDGTWVNAYDGINIRYDSEDWTFEAEWTADGARCLGTARLANSVVPVCPNGHTLEDCGNPDSFDKDTLLVSEVLKESEL